MSEVTVYGNPINEVANAVLYKDAKNVQVRLKGEKFEVTMWFTKDFADKLHIVYEERD